MPVVDVVDIVDAFDVFNAQPISRRLSSCNTFIGSRAFYTVDLI